MRDETVTRKNSLYTILITGIVSLVVGVGSGVLINYFTLKSPKLTYDITTQEVFPGNQNNIGIFAIRISNDGKREIEQLLCNIQFPNGKITEKKITGIPNSATNISGTDSSIEVTIPFLNPGEYFSIQALLGEVIQPFSNPNVEVRGKGILGSEVKSDKKPQNTFSDIFAVAIAALATLLTAFATVLSRLKRGGISIKRFKDLVNRSQHSADQRDTIAFALDTCGLNEDAQIIREWPRKITYWAASDTLCYKWLKNADQERLKMGINSFELLISYAAITEDSERIIRLNMAKLAIAVKDQNLAEKYFTSASRKKDPIIEKRIQASDDLSSLVSKKNG